MSRRPVHLLTTPGLVDRPARTACGTSTLRALSLRDRQTAPESEWLVAMTSLAVTRIPDLVSCLACRRAMGGEGEEDACA